MSNNMWGLDVLLTNIKYSGSGLACCVWSWLTASQLHLMLSAGSGGAAPLHSTPADDILFWDLVSRDTAEDGENLNSAVQLWFQGQTYMLHIGC